MARFNLDDYETVKNRKKRFYDTYPEGRITVEPLNVEHILDYALFKATIYKSEKDTPLASGCAMELRDKEKKISNSGKQYETVNYTSWTENCEESAVGRALDNAGFASNMKCSRDEIEKVERMSKVLADKASSTSVEKLNVIRGKLGAMTDGFKDTDTLNKLITELGYDSAADLKQCTEKELDQILSVL